MSQDEYVEAEVQRLLAEHAEVAEQGITIARRDHGLVLTGEVASEHRREEIERLVREHFPDVELSVDIGLTRVQPPSDVEELP